jgi:hypothetical protein
LQWVLGRSWYSAFTLGGEPFYILAPLLVPFTAYSFPSGQWNIFALERLGWPINIGYSAVLALAATWLGRKLPFWKALALFALLVLLASAVVHVAMATLGYQYRYDTP